MFQNILDGSVTTHPTECEDDFPNIVECMAAGRYLYPAYYKYKIHIKRPWKASPFPIDLNDYIEGNFLPLAIILAYYGFKTTLSKLCSSFETLNFGLHSEETGSF